MKRISLRDRVPTVVLTEPDGTFKHGPVEKDDYDVHLAKDGWAFEPNKSDRKFDFLAIQLEMVNVQV